MRALTAIVLCGLGLGLAGCPPVRDKAPVEGGGTGNGDGVACSGGDTRGQPAVYIDLDYGQADVPPCEVDRYARVTWRAPAGGEGFRLDFGSVGPAGRGEPTRYASMPSGDLHKVQLQADAEPGQYGYQVIVGETPVDPVIIIRR